MPGSAATVENREVTRLGLHRKDSTGSALTGKRLGTDPLRYGPFCSRGGGLQLCFGTNPIGVGRFRPPGLPGGLRGTARRALNHLRALNHRALNHSVKVDAGLLALNHRALNHPVL